MRKGRTKYYFKNKNAVINDVGKLCDMNEQLEQELDKYKNIVDEALGIANERINYYAHKQIEAEDWSEIFNVLIKKDNQELKGE